MLAPLFPGKEPELAFNVSGHVLHSLLWRNMSPKGGGEPDGELAAAVKEYFGSFAGLKGQLSEACLMLVLLAPRPTPAAGRAARR